MKQKIAAFDIDGTVFRWQLFFSLVFELKKRNAFDQATSDELERSLRGWQGKELTWREFTAVVAPALLSNLPKIEVATYLEACKQVVESEGHKVHSYTLNLAKSLQKEGYRTIAITGSSQEIAELFAMRHGFDICLGEVYEQKDGKFTGVVQSVVDQKDVVLRKYVHNNPDVTLEESIGVGDSYRDQKLLETVEHPIAFNPDGGLLDVAMERSWKIVIERKNLAYVLHGDNSTYALNEVIRH